MNLIEIVTLLCSIALGAYTGFLLSALVSYPMLNNPVLPILFLHPELFRHAALIVCALLFTKECTRSTSMAFLHKFEFPVVLAESLLFAFSSVYTLAADKNDCL